MTGERDAEAAPGHGQKFTSETGRCRRARPKDRLP
jgi:hypothetical protein